MPLSCVFPFLIIVDRVTGCHLEPSAVRIHHYMFATSPGHCSRLLCILLRSQSLLTAMVGYFGEVYLLEAPIRARRPGLVASA